jgi:hypothetical protein
MQSQRHLHFALLNFNQYNTIKKKKKRQSPLNKRVIGHHRPKTAKITKGKGWV